MTYRNLFAPDCLPTKALRIGSMNHEVPSRSELARALFDHYRVVAGYEIVCALLAEARMHLAQVLPDNWQEHPDMVAAVDFLGGVDALDELRQAEAPDEAKLP